MGVETWNFKQDWYEDKDFARVTASSRYLTRFGELLNHTFTSGTKESKTKSSWAEHMEDCKVDAGDWLAQNLELSKDFTLADLQIHQTAVSMPHQPTKVTRTTSIREPSLIEPTNVTKCPKQVHQLQHNRGWSDHGLKQIRHGKIIGNILVENIHKTCGTHQNTTVGGGYFKTKGSFTGDRWIQLTYWSTSWLTPHWLKAISHFLLHW